MIGFILIRLSHGLFRSVPGTIPVLTTGSCFMRVCLYSFPFSAPLWAKYQYYPNYFRSYFTNNLMKKKNNLMKKENNYRKKKNVGSYFTNNLMKKENNFRKKENNLSYSVNNFLQKENVGSYLANNDRNSPVSIKN